MKRLWRVVREVPKETTLTFELEEGKFSCFNPAYTQSLAEQIQNQFGIEEEQKEEVKKILRNYGYESKISFILQLLGYNTHHIDDASAEHDGSLSIISEGKRRPRYMQEYHQLVWIIHQGLKDIKDPGEREVIAICAAYIFFDPKQYQKIVDYQYNKGLKGIDIKVSSSTIQRDQTMEERIRKIWNESDVDLLHVGGMFHLYGPYHNLNNRLQDLNPIRRKLNEF